MENSWQFHLKSEEFLRNLLALLLHNTVQHTIDPVDHDPGNDEVKFDLPQENRNKDLKNEIKLMGPTKQTKELIVQVGHQEEKDRLLKTMISRWTELFMHVLTATGPQFQRKRKYWMDLQTLKPFDRVPNQKHKSFQEIR